MNKTCAYFEKIMSIPRPSGNEKKIADFLFGIIIFSFFTFLVFFSYV